MNKRAQEFVRLQGALCLSGDVMGVLIEVGVDPVDGFVLGLVISLALFRRQVCCHDLAASIEGSCDDMGAFLETQTDEGFHNRDRAVRAVLQDFSE